MKVDWPGVVPVAGWLGEAAVAAVDRPGVAAVAGVDPGPGIATVAGVARPGVAPGTSTWPGSGYC